MNTAQFTPAGTTTAEDLGRIHLIGVGGVGMSGLARLFLTRGLPVSGSELREWPSLAGLRALGGTIHMTHEASNLDGVDTVVYSSAIPQDHLEMVEARRRGLRLLHRSEALAAAMTGRRTVAVAGTHGKTTTTSMVTMVLQQAGTDPSFVIGGEISEVGSGAHHGTGEYFVVEADESDRSFLIYRPFVSVITNIEADHLNTYGDLASLEAAFADFARLTDPEGFIITCADDPGGRRLAETLRAEGRRVWTYGESADADLRLSDMASSAQGVRYLATIEGRSLGEIRMPVPGRHMALNSAVAVLTAYLLGLPVTAAEAALGAFPGVRRRFERKGVADGVLVYDEYAYHPTSMTLALQTLREVAGEGRLIVVFQPYRLYRTRDLQAEIAAALAIADELVLLEVFGPGELRQPGEGAAALIAAVPLPAERKVFVEAWDDVPAEVARRARPGDVVVTMGAPPISLMGDQLLDALLARTGEPGGAAAIGTGVGPDGAAAAAG
ncbi:MULTISPECIES: UDP-N-acetylmuramate--L-alanine ligase [Micromonospora]|uniref:UDP-N-acetylmuramate--L-alanine ligase n=1 Tax=Micromonospora solifontis TaxID=2487138 RepID=A0ABX9WG56_9ACTN|nr:MULTISPECIES: UDP-N-acetylmuramate--L-alanine ligase [Micromonospora]NES12256.1 UDP-N-acetylmuramate--L-alanine ligase [Micromonospora sp. PPF5-17B]NES36941.1 UDP-N-acetylmuramate--L-alanine ligase [Micromonospora solifontis]NES54261.1 UDP-N-acetylmuramate--L-alanine ligase [Micromonospora sp. PPF5-6]RNL98863.1 UDP-N-acetylmuramate--L-alanine ligase [Micromonospora solifontis]